MQVCIDGDGEQVARSEDRAHGRAREGGQNKERVAGFLREHHFVHVLVTVNEVAFGEFKPKTFEVSGHTCHEALITHNDFLRWCPLAAYSACDARVLQ